MYQFKESLLNKRPKNVFVYSNLTNHAHINIRYKLKVPGFKGRNRNNVYKNKKPIDILIVTV